MLARQRPLYLRFSAGTSYGTHSSTTIVMSIPEHLSFYTHLISAVGHMDRSRLCASMLIDPQHPAYWRAQEEEARTIMSSIVARRDMDAVRFFQPLLLDFFDEIYAGGFHALADLQFYVDAAQFYSSLADSSDDRLASVLPPMPSSESDFQAWGCSLVASVLTDMSADMFCGLLDMLTTLPDQQQQLLSFARSVSTIPCIMNADVWIATLRGLDFSTHSVCTTSFVDFMCQVLHGALDHAISSGVHGGRRLRSTTRNLLASSATPAFPAALFEPPPGPAGALSMIDALATSFHDIINKRGTIELDGVEYDLVNAPLSASMERAMIIVPAFRVYCAVTSVIDVAKRLGWMNPQERLADLALRLPWSETPAAPGSAFRGMLCWYNKNASEFHDLQLLPLPHMLVPDVCDYTPILIE